MKLQLACFKKTPMDNLRETIHQNEALNKEAHHVRSIATIFFNSVERTLEQNL